ncbi:MAG: Tfp pilus assembly protein FimT/FimU [Betaproteobacteria bacterium]
MAMLLVSLSVMAVMMTVAMPVWKHQIQRERETELVFRGEQYARAIGLFQRKMGPGVLPPSIDLLVEQRFLRKKFKDPITNDDFQPILAGQTPVAGSQTPGQMPGRGGPTTQQPGAAIGRAPTGTSPIGTPAAGATGGIIGVVSKSKEKSIRLYNGRDHYNEWAFLFTAQTQQPGAVPGAVAPGVRPGQRGPGGVLGPGERGRGRGGPSGPNDGRGGRGPGSFNPFRPPPQPRRPGG